jgi:hypothetical protein
LDFRLAGEESRGLIIDKNPARFPAIENVRVCRDVDIRDFDPFRIFLHLEKGSPRLVRRRTGEA